MRYTRLIEGLLILGSAVPVKKKSASPSMSGRRTSAVTVQPELIVIEFGM